MNIIAWTEEFAERGEMLRDYAYKLRIKRSKKTRDVYDMGAAERELEIAELVMLRMTGMFGKLEEAWRGQ